MATTKKQKVPTKKVAAKPAKSSKKPPAAAKPKVAFPGRLEIATAKKPVIEELPLREALPGGALFAAHLTAGELGAHLYVAHRHLETKEITLLVYLKAKELGGKAGAGLRVPQPGGWLCCPADGVIFVVASPRPLSRGELIDLLQGRAPAPVKGDDTNMAQKITVPLPG